MILINDKSYYRETLLPNTLVDYPKSPVKQNIILKDICLPQTFYFNLKYTNVDSFPNFFDVRPRNVSADWLSRSFLRKSHP